MARTFGGAANDQVNFDDYTAVNDLTLMTLMAWTYRTGDGGSSGGRVFHKNDANTDSMTILNQASTTSYNFAFFRWSTSGGQWSMPRPSTSVWAHVAVTYDAGSTSNDPLMYLDGTSQTVTDVDIPAGTLNSDDTANIHIGNRQDTNRNWAGRLAEITFWNVILTAAEIAALARGMHPLRIRPNSQVFYAPIWGTSPEVNLRGTQNGTVTGTVVADHPPIEPYGWTTYSFPTIVVAAGGQPMRARWSQVPHLGGNKRFAVIGA